MKLRQEIFFRVAALLAVTIIVITSMYLFFSTKYHRESTIDTYIIRAEVLSHRFTQLILWDDRVAIKSLLMKEVESFEELDYAYILKGETPYEYSFRDGVPKQLIEQAKDKVFLFQNQKKHEMYNISVNIIDDYSLNLGICQNIIDKNMSSLHTLVGMLVILIMIIVGIIANFISKHTTREVDALVGAVQLFNEKMNFEYKADIKHGSDVQLLVKFFNKMINEREKSQKALRDSEELFRSITDAAQDAIVVIDDLGAVILFNKSAEKIFKVSAEFVIGKSIQTLLSSDKQSAQFAQSYKNFAMTGEGKNIGKLVELDAKRFDGELFTVELSLAAVKLKNKWHAVGIMRDLSERKELEEKLNQVQKMEAIGTLAGGIAHDFNNILTAINGYTEIGLMGFSNDTTELFLDIHKSAEKATHLVRQLLGFSRKQMIQPIIINISSLVLDLNKMLKRMISEDIKIVIHIEGDLPYILADPSQIEQIFINLVVNARDAIHDNPKTNQKLISISLSSKFVSEKLKDSYFDLDIGRYLVMSVSDTGIGIDKEDIGKIFEPFYTTKEQGKGTGLGLANVFGILKQNKGNITVYSEKGLGTTFNVYWPVKNINTERTESVKKEGLKPGNETIILVEDDLEIIKFVSKGLSILGYTVRSYSNPLIALDEIPKLEEKIDLLITDIIMPNLNGKEFIDKLMLQMPHIRVLFTSGHADEHVINQGILTTDNNFISKPFNMVSLSNKIRLIIDEKTKTS